MTRPGDTPSAERTVCGRRRAPLLLIAPGPYVRLHLRTDASQRAGAGYRLQYRAGERGNGRDGKGEGEEGRERESREKGVA